MRLGGLLLLTALADLGPSHVDASPDPLRGSALTPPEPTHERYGDDEQHADDDERHDERLDVVRACTISVGRGATERTVRGRRLALLREDLRAVVGHGACAALAPARHSAHGDERAIPTSVDPSITGLDETQSLVDGLRET